MKGWKKTCQANGNQNKAGVAILISDKRDFKLKMVKRDKEGHYIMIKGSIHQEKWYWSTVGYVTKNASEDFRFHS